MNKSDIVFELDEMETPLRLCKVALNKGYISAAVSYLDDIESEAIRLRAAIQEQFANVPKPTAANYLHPNDPNYEPFAH